MSEISIIIPIYKVEKYVSRCLRSVFSQTIADKIEYILVNDCTPDSSMIIVKQVIAEYPELQNQIHVFEHSINKGLPDARKTGVIAASGKYIIHIDSDDYCEPNMLEKLYNTAIETESDIVSCDIIMEYGHKQIIKKEPPGSTPVSAIKKILVGDMDGYLHIKLIKKELYDKNGILPIANINLWEDVILSVQLYYFANKIAYVPSALYHYVQYNENSICSNFSDKSIQDLISAVSVIEYFFYQQKSIPDYFTELLFMKARIKSMILMQTVGNEQKKYFNLFLEVDKHILRAKHIPIYNKLGTWFFTHKLYLLGLIIKNVVIFARNIRAKTKKR